MQERFFLLNLVKRFGGDDGLHLRAIGGERFGQLVKVNAKLLADFGVDGRRAVVKGLDGGRCGVRAIEENRGDHVCGFHAEVCIIHAVAEERAVQGEGICAGVVGDTGLVENLGYGDLSVHDPVVGGGEHGVYPANQRSGGGDDLIASAREQWNDGSNTLCIAPGKIVVYERNDVTNAILRDEGIQVLEMPSAELSRGRGGPRCMSMPIIRAE